MQPLLKSLYLLVILLVGALQYGESRVNQKMVAPVEIEEEEVDNMMMSLEDPRKLQGNNECSAFWLCDSILGFDGRKVRNTDPLLGDECVDRCIPGPILWLFLGPLNYECGICFGS